MGKEGESRLEKFRKFGDLFSIGLLGIAFITASSGLAAAAALDLAVSQTIGKEIVKKFGKKKKRS